MLINKKRILYDYIAWSRSNKVSDFHCFFLILPGLLDLNYYFFLLSLYFLRDNTGVFMKSNYANVLFVLTN